jgi:hypothetical protein
VPTEEKLLNIIFDDGSSPNERAHAVETLKKTTGKDRAGLVEKYTDDADDAETYRWFWESEKNRRVQAEAERDVAKIDLSDALRDLLRFKDLTRRLAAAALDARWLDPDEHSDFEV